MSNLNHDLPEPVVPWLEQVGAGTVTRLRRHVARREAWLVDVTRPDGSVLEGFLRIQRDDTGPDPRRLEREARIVDALGRTDIPVNAVHGWNPDLRTVLFGRDPGSADIDKLDDPDQQRAIMVDFIKTIARMHQLDIDDLDLDDVMPPRPTSARGAALDVVDRAVDGWRFFLDGHVDPIVTYSLEWLRRFAPDSVARISLVQGDTGPVNFMFQGDRVSSIIDLEDGHWGDPMEDLGNIRVREFWNPCGGLQGLFELYAAESGIPYSRFGAQYYSVQQNIRGLIPISYICLNAHPTESLSRYLCYRTVGARMTAEVLAEAMEVEITRPTMPADEDEPDILARSAMAMLDKDVATELDDEFARSRVDDVKALIACMERRHRYGPLIEATEVDEMAGLLGRVPETFDDGSAELERRLAEQTIDDESAVRYLARRAYRDEWLHAPAVALYPERTWSPID